MEDNIEMLTPEWFQEKAKEFPNIDTEAEKFIIKFKEKFAPEKLKELSGNELLYTIFLNNKDKTTLCYVLEFDSDSTHMFGGIGSGSAYKYGLFCQKKNSSWVTGTGNNPYYLSEGEAIELGTKIRDNLVAGAEKISEKEDIRTLEEYQNLYDDLVEVTEGYINRVWFLKYYAILFPKLFPAYYSESVQNRVLDILKIKAGNNSVYRCGQIREYADKCNVSNSMFNKIVGKYCFNKVEQMIEYISTVANENNLVGVVREKQPNLTNYKINNEGNVVFYTIKSGKSVTLFFKTKYLSQSLCDLLTVANDDMGWNRKITFKNDLDENDQQLISDLLHCVGTFEMVVSQKNDNQKKPRTDKEHPINFIVYGAPGTGKTYSMVEYALAIVDNISIEDFQKDNQDRKTNIARYKELVNDGQIVFTTFHQNYGYEDFIQGLRPDTSRGTLSFKIVDGLFKKIADKALDDGDNNYVIIIDEINRANISKVFGELITLIEEDKRWGELNEMSVTLQSGDDFVVPNNLYIIGTMNSADKSISLIDAALRRRFEFIEKKPDASLVQNDILRKIFISINENLVKELDSTDLLVGHSYFMNKTEKDLCKILNNNIIPLLYEYFYDNRKKVATLLKEVIDESCANVEIVDEKMGRLSVKDKVE
jgi:hypothetical protein